MSQPQVLIVGAGPTGLVLALWLARAGVPFRLIDKNPGPGQASRAMAVQARTLEFYRQLGIADEVVAAGFRLDRLHLRNRSRELAVVPLGDVGSGHQPVPVRPQPPAGRPRAAADRAAPRGRPRRRVGHRADRVHAAGRRRAGHAPQARRRGDVGRGVPVRVRRGAQHRPARAGRRLPGRDVRPALLRRRRRGGGAVVRPRHHRLHRRADVLPGLPGPGAGHVPVHRPRPRGPPGPRRPRVRRPPRGGRAGDGDAGDAGELVLDVPRPPPGRRPLPARAGVPVRGRRARPQPGRRPGDEHRHRRRGEPGLEARRRPRRAGGARPARLLRGRADPVRPVPGARRPTGSSRPSSAGGCSPGWSGPSSPRSSCRSPCGSRPSGGPSSGSSPRPGSRTGRAR